MGLEQKINYQLNKYPAVKRVAKRIYQRTMYTFCPKVKSEGDIKRVSPDDQKNEYFFGYYDKSPWDITDRYMLCMRAGDTRSDASPKEKADILLIDTSLPESEPKRVRKIAETSSWNVQQSCMLQWLGPDFSSHILYNDCRNGKYVAVILELLSGSERIIPMPVYTVSADGKTALTLDFSRLYNLRPGYGYYNVPEKSQGIGLPDGTAVWRIDLVSGRVTELLTYKDFVALKPRPEMLEDGAVHKVNHLMLRPDGKRFMVLYRWFIGQRKYTRLITCDSDGSNMYVLSDDDMVSHCCWKNNSSILAFENKKGGGPGYYLMKDKTQHFIHCWPQISNDGHPSYSPEGSQIVTDTYPDRQRMAEIKLMDGRNEREKGVNVIARVFAPFTYDNDTRCDLHPRWNHAGDKICFDAVFEGHRGLYTAEWGKGSGEKYKIVLVLTSCKRSGPVEIMYNMVKYLDRDQFLPILITLYDETRNESELNKFKELGVAHYHIPLGKTEIMLNRTKSLKKKLKELEPSIIHSQGVFPNYAVAAMGFKNHVLTLHNYMYEDFRAKYGKVLGTAMEIIERRAVIQAARVWTCSESLAWLYRNKKGLRFPFIRNGVDLSTFGNDGRISMEESRKLLALPADGKIFVYTGQVIDRKNQEFLLRIFTRAEGLKKYFLLLLGDGSNYKKLSEKYGVYPNIIFKGNVDNVSEYLLASNYYISSSISEGLPTGVLEALACGLPVILSDILQHKEIYEANAGIGSLYRLNDSKDCLAAIKDVLKADYTEMSENARKCVEDNFSAKIMSKNYQDEYRKVIEKTIKDKGRIL